MHTCSMIRCGQLPSAFMTGVDKPAGAEVVPIGKGR
jgi:hypothetical protein